MKELKAIWAFIVGLNPFAAPADPPRDKIELLEFVEARASVEVRADESAADSKARAEDQAMRDAVDEVIRRYSVKDAPLERFERRIRSHYKDYVGRVEVARDTRENGRHEVLAKVFVHADPLRESLIEHGVRKPGEHLELEILVTPVKGKATEADDLGSSVFIDEKAWSATLMGLGMRWYFTDSFHASVSGQWLTKSVDIGTYRQGSGATGKPITLKQFTPVTFMLGFKLYDQSNVRFIGGAGVGMVRIRQETTTGVPLFPSQWVPGLAARFEAQYVPFDNVGFGARAEYFQRNKYSLLGGKAFEPLMAGVHLIVGF